MIFLNKLELKKVKTKLSNFAENIVRLDKHIFYTSYIHNTV